MMVNQSPPNLIAIVGWQTKWIKFLQEDLVIVIGWRPKREEYDKPHSVCFDLP
jgi:hypothetical protein